MVRAARKTTRVGAGRSAEVYGYRSKRVASYAAYDLHLAMEQLASALVNWDDRQVSINNDIGRRALTYLSELYQAGMPPGSGTFSEDDYDAIIHGKVAMQPASTVIMQSDIGTSRLEPSRIAGPLAGEDIIKHAAGVLYMVQGSKNPDATWRVMEAFVSSRNLTAMHKQGMEIRFPVRRSLFTQLKDLFPTPLHPS